MIITAGIAIVIFLISYVFVKHRKMLTKEPTQWCQNTTSLRGKTVIVTGANEGKYLILYAKSKTKVDFKEQND